MAPPRPFTAHAGKVRPLFFEVVSTLASLIFLATGVFVLEENAGSQLGAFFAVIIGVFGLYGTILGILDILDITCPRASTQTQTR
jgi:hypothetical protein